MQKQDAAVLPRFSAQERADGPGRIAAWLLDLHHIGAQVAEELGHVRPGHLLGQLHHA